MNPGRGLVTLVGLVLAGFALGLGVLAGSVVVALLVCAGFYLVWAGCGAVEMRKYWWAWLAIVLGVAATLDAVWLGDMAGRWFWLPVLLVMGLAVVAAGSSAWPDSRRHGEALVALGVLVMVFAVLAPLVVYPSLAPSSEATAGTAGGFSAVEGLRAVGSALLETATSFWGWVDLAALVLLGVASWRRGGAVLAPALVAAAVFFAGGFSAETGEAVAEAVGKSPASWIESLMISSDEHWGSAGWGVLVLAAGVVLASLPVVRKLVAMSQVAAAASRAEGSDDEAVVRFMTVEGYGTGWSSVIVLAFEILCVGTAAMLWAGLRWAADEVGVLPFDLIRIPDLAVPHFRPVWEISYFALAVILGASAVLTGRIFAHVSVARRVPVLTNPVWQVGAVVLAAFVMPAGVLLFGVGVTWLQTVAVLSLRWPVRLRHDDVYAAGVRDSLGTPTGEATGVAGGPVWATGDGPGVAPSDGGPDGRAPGPGSGGSGAMRGGSDDRPIWDRDGGDEPPIWTDAEQSDETGDGGTGADAAAAGPPRPSVSAVTSLFDAGPVLDLVHLGGQEYVVLGAMGDLTLFRDGIQSRHKRLQVIRPLGIGLAAARDVAFVDGGGRVLQLSFSEPEELGQPGRDPIATVHSGVIEVADCFAVSPLGNLVATALSDRPPVFGFFLTSEIGRPLFEGGEPPTALGFSLDGRLVAVGTTSGDVQTVDVGGQGVTSVLSGRQAGGRTVVAVTGASGGDWVVAYADERVALWRGGDKLRSVDAGGAITSLAVDLGSGRIAVGTAFGLVRVLNESFSTRVAEARPFAAEVRRLLWIDGGATVVCASANGEVRSIVPR